MHIFFRSQYFLVGHVVIDDDDDCDDRINEPPIGSWNDNVIDDCGGVDDDVSDDWCLDLNDPVADDDDNNVRCCCVGGISFDSFDTGESVRYDCWWYEM